MKKLITICLALICLGLSPAMAQQAAQVNVYGKNFPNAPVLSPGRLPYIQKSNTLLNKPLIMTGLVITAGKNNGGWLKLVTNKQMTKHPLLVKVKDAAFKVPENVVGKSVAVYGRLQKTNAKEATYVFYATSLKVQE